MKGSYPMWTKPNRPKDEVTQTFNDGIVDIYEVTNGASVGYKPIEALALRCELRFSERKVGVTRFYDAKQAQIEIEKVIRVPRYEMTTQDVAKIGSAQYRIVQIQKSDTYPPSCDLTLSRIEEVNEYEIL